MAVFLTLLFGGILALVTGLVITRLHWRTDIPPYGVRTNFLDVTRHPDRYAQDAPLGIITTLNLAGVFLLMGAVGTLLFELLRGSAN